MFLDKQGVTSFAAIKLKGPYVMICGEALLSCLCYVLLKHFNLKDTSASIVNTGVTIKQVSKTDVNVE